MARHDFTTSFTLSCTPQQIFDAVVDPRAWWSRDIAGVADAEGGEFEFEVPGVHWTRFRVTELVAPERVVWSAVDSDIAYVADHSEWTGTEVRFVIETTDAGAVLRFTHAGLVPQIECYDACSTAWTSYIGESLRQLVATGVGDPDQEDRAD